MAGDQADNRESPLPATAQRPLPAEAPAKQPAVVERQDVQWPVVANARRLPAVADSGGSARWSSCRAASCGSLAALQLGDDPLRQHLAQLDAPLVERVDVPDRALREDAVLVQRDQLAQQSRASAARPGWCSTAGCPRTCGAAPASPACPRPCTSSAVLPNASASVCAKTFAISRSWWSPSGLSVWQKPMKSHGISLRPLVDELVERVLAVGARLAPVDRRRSA